MDTSKISNSNHEQPLCWGEARARLRNLLTTYLNEPLTTTQPTDDNVSQKRDSFSENSERSERCSFLRSFLTSCIHYDVDLYLAILCSLGLLVVACFCLADTATDQKQGNEQVAAAVLLTVTSQVSLWMVLRRRRLFLKDGDNAKRREILKFLKVMGKTTPAKWETESKSSRGTKPSGQNGGNGAGSDHGDTETVYLEGTALTGIYPVYRRPEIVSASSADPTEATSPTTASWSRVPGLLLVEGDLIALQIGDVAPATCMIYDEKRDIGDTTRTQVAEGETIGIASFGEMTEDIMAQLPAGRRTLAPDSEHLLTLCNRMRIFCVLEAPLASFLRREPALSKPPQIWRQVCEIRKGLFLVAVLLLVVTAIILFSRPGIGGADLFLILPLPLLAAIGMFPVVSPLFGFFLEVFGTARILATVHPFAAIGRAERERELQRKLSAMGAATRFPQTLLLSRYVFAIILSRLSLWTVAHSVRRLVRRVSWKGKGGSRSGGSDTDPSSAEYAQNSRDKLVRVPPASINLLEKLGAVTAFTLVDDELACEPQAIPQQLLIPSEKGLKLLDLCPAYDDDTNSDDYSVSDAPPGGRRRVRSFDSDSEESDEDGSEAISQTFHANLRRKILRTKLRRRRKTNPASGHSSCSDDDTDATTFEVQFEEPTWWQHLPSLKCIGLACSLLGEERKRSFDHALDVDAEFYPPLKQTDTASVAKSALVKLVCAERRSNQLRSLAQCIGFSTESNLFGERGDLTPFHERLRVHVLSDSLYRERLESDAHERSSEQSRWWGIVRPDSTSIIVQDSRSDAYQMLTAGDPAVVTSLCNEAWQGEISTILPLSQIDRRTILETANSWKLGDLDVAAFSYSPVPHTVEQRLRKNGNLKSQMYLLDHGNRGAQTIPLLKDKNVSAEWSLIKNQVFLGVLGSLVVPRREIQNLLNILNDAGVRFVYFSPRNMRRQKELASQMGIDVAWNCAISLRPLESGEDDPHRMVSNYADWDVNAKLPHGIENVRKHLKEVDNVPLLVSLYTDVTKKTTKEMVEIFQDYNDTVIAIGLSHLPWNGGIFSTADIAVGIDVLTERLDDLPSSRLNCFAERPTQYVSPLEVEFASAIASHSCAFRFRGIKSLSHLSDIIEQGRSSLDAAISAAIFLIAGCLAFSFFILLSVCTASITLPYVPVLGSVIYLLILLPGMGLALALSDGDSDTMQRVPPKNDQNITFGRNEGRRLYSMVALKAIPPAVLPQILYLIAFGELVIAFDPQVLNDCPGATSWVDVIRCDALRDYSGPARISSGILVWAEFVFCIAIISSGFVHRFITVKAQPPWDHNTAWVFIVIAVLVVTTIYVSVAVEDGTASALPWFYYLLAVVMPFLCLIWNECLKLEDGKQERRAEKLRRLQFETRLGAWSPK